MAVEHLHGKCIVHRDLKLGNVFQGLDGSIKVGDLGLASILESPADKRSTVCGTPNYIAPEVLSQGGGYGMPVDIW